MIKIIDCAQGSEEWFRARMGMPTASEFATILAEGRKGTESKIRKTYMRKLAGELLTGEPDPSNYANANMERGKLMEAEARANYELDRGLDVTEVGFIINGNRGCSPDALIGNDGLVEVKTKFPHLLIECHEQDVFPAEHKAQCQGGLWVAEREWIDIFCYWPKLRPFVKRAYRDDAYIKELAAAVDKFNDELRALVEFMRRISGGDVRSAA